METKTEPLTLTVNGKYKALDPDKGSFYFIARARKMDEVLPNKEILDAWPYAFNFEKDEYGSEYGFNEYGAKVRIVKCLTPEEISEAKKEFVKDYPHIYAIGACVDIDEIGPPYVPRDIKSAALKKMGKKAEDKFHDWFGIQTCHVKGPYPWDVEAVLHRMKTGKLTGTQLLWD